MPRYRFEGDWQYPTRADANWVRDTLTNVWISSWSQYILSNPDNGHNAFDYDPPVSEAGESEVCNAGVHALYHIEVNSSPGEQTFDAIFHSFFTVGWAEATCGSRSSLVSG